MSLMSLSDRLHLPVWDDPAEAIFQRVDIDLEACDGCKLCVVACPANALELFGDKGSKKSRVKQGNLLCISCNNCMAICSRQAIQARKSIDFAGYYQQLGQGEFSLPRKF